MALDSLIFGHPDKSGAGRRISDADPACAAAYRTIRSSLPTAMFARMQLKQLAKFADLLTNCGM